MWGGLSVGVESAREVTLERGLGLRAESMAAWRSVSLSVSGRRITGCPHLLWKLVEDTHTESTRVSVGCFGRMLRLGSRGGRGVELCLEYPDVSFKLGILCPAAFGHADGVHDRCMISTPKEPPDFLE